MTPSSLDPSSAAPIPPWARSHSLPDLPWAEKPAGQPHPGWRLSANPVIPRSPFPKCNSVFNSVVVLFKNVTFPIAALCGAPSGRIAVDYGCADPFTGVVFCQIDELLDWLHRNSCI